VFLFLWLERKAMAAATTPSNKLVVGRFFLF
jgi:hypothetical protein